MKIGVILSSFKLPMEQAVKTAKKIGADGLQIHVKDLALDESCAEQKCRDLVRIIKDEGLEVSALCGDLGCKMFYTGDRALIDMEKRLMEYAKIFGTNIVTTHIGAVSENKNCSQYESMQKVCRELAEFADSMNGHFAVETGPERSEILRDFLDSLGSRGVAVNLDPANLVMCARDNAADAVYNLRDYIVHTHAKDGKNLHAVDLCAYYAGQYYGLEKPQRPGRELPLGEGDVNFEKYLNALRDIGYDGYLTIEREVGENPTADIEHAVKFLDTFGVR